MEDEKSYIQRSSDQNISRCRIFLQIVKKAYLVLNFAKMHNKIAHLYFYYHTLQSYMISISYQLKACMPLDVLPWHIYCFV